MNAIRSRSKVTILIVEDSPTQAEQLKFTLEQHGYTILVARNGREALDTIHTNRPSVVITDIVMPEMDGYELCKRIRTHASFSTIPVILLTSLSDFFDVIRGLECGADHFLVKPCDEEYLISKIEYILAHRHLQSEDFSQLALEITLRGQKYSITSTRLQILNLLLSSFESAVQKNRELRVAQDSLQNLNSSLEEKVRVRTESLALEISERLAAEVQLQHRLELEAAIARISRLLVGSADPDVHQILEIVGTVLNVQRTSIYQYKKHKESFECTHEWCEPETLSIGNDIRDIIAVEYLWTVERLSAGETIVFRKETALPSQAVEELKKLNVERSTVFIPYFSTAGKLLGFFRVDDTNTLRDWNEDDLRSLRIVVEMLASSEEIKAAQRAVREKDKLYRDAIQVADAVPYYQNYATDTYDFVGEGIKAITGFSSDEFTRQVFGKNVLETILLEDIEALTQDEAVRKVKNESDREWKADYRFSHEGRSGTVVE